jgi:predicted ester cyclase
MSRFSALVHRINNIVLGGSAPGLPNSNFGPFFAVDHQTMSREKLLEFSDRYKVWFDSRSTDIAAVSNLVAPDVKLLIPFNGLPGTFDGLVAHHARVLEATNDLKSTILERYVDEAKSIVTAYLHFAGHHTGYVLRPRSPDQQKERQLY